jgi:hypothetical protein
MTGLNILMRTYVRDVLDQSYGRSYKLRYKKKLRGF